MQAAWKTGWVIVALVTLPLACSGDDEDGGSGGSSGQAGSSGTGGSAGSGTGGSSGSGTGGSAGSGTGGSAGSGTGGSAGSGTGGSAGSGTGGSAGSGTGGAAGSGTGGAAGSGDAGLNPVSADCKACAAQNCANQVAACTGNATCNACVNVDYQDPGCKDETHYKAVCACAVSNGGPCHNQCGQYCAGTN